MRISTIFALICGLFAIQGCSKSSGDGDTFYLDISRTTITLTSASSAVEAINLDCSHSWTTSCGADWITISPSSGGAGETTVTLVIKENTVQSERSATITFSADGYDKTINVVQPAGTSGTSYLNLDRELIALTSSDADTQSIKVTASEEWTAVVTAGTWLSISPNTGSAGESTSTITIKENTTAEIRTSTIKFSIGDDDYDKVLTITQPISATMDAISIDPTSKNLETADEEVFSLTVTANAAWAASSIPDWVTLSKEEGDGTETISVTCKENTDYIARAEATILFTSGTATATLTLNQAAAVEPMLTLDALSNSVTSAAGNFTIELTANTSWSVRSDLDWVTSITPSSSTSDATVKVYYSEQTLTSVRSGDIIFTYNNKEVKYTLTQEGAAQSVISISPSETQNIAATGDIITVTVTCNAASFTATSNKTWATPLINGSTVTITCAENTTTSPEVAVVTFEASTGESTSLTINQAAADAYCYISPAEDITVYKVAIDQQFTITSNTAWSISSSDSWFTFEGDTSGSGNGTVRLKAEANNTSVAKSAKITLQATGCEEAVVINVTQSAPQLPDFNTEEL